MQIVLSGLKAVKPATANAQPTGAETVMTMPGKWRCHRMAYLEYWVPLTTGLHFVSHLHFTTSRIVFPVQSWNLLMTAVSSCCQPD